MKDKESARVPGNWEEREKPCSRLQKHQWLVKQYLGLCNEHEWMVVIRLCRKITDSRSKGRVGQQWGVPHVRCPSRDFIDNVPWSYIFWVSSWSCWSTHSFLSCLSNHLGRTNSTIGRDNLHAQEVPCFRWSARELGRALERYKSSSRSWEQQNCLNG